MSHRSLDAVATVAGSTIRVAVGDERRMIAEALAALVDTMSGFEASAVVAGEAGVCTLRRTRPTWSSLAWNQVPERDLAWCE